LVMSRQGTKRDRSDPNLETQAGFLLEVGSHEWLRTLSSFILLNHPGGAVPRDCKRRCLTTE